MFGEADFVLTVAKGGLLPELRGPLRVDEFVANVFADRFKLQFKSVTIKRLLVCVLRLSCLLMYVKGLCPITGYAS